MSVQKEFQIKKAINDINHYVNHLEENDSFEKLSKEKVKELDEMFKSDLQGTFFMLSPETKILFVETCLQVKGKADTAEHYLEMFFKSNIGNNQYYLRGLLAKASIISLQIESQGLKAEEAVDKARESVKEVFAALQIISQPENKQKYAFLVYNASICVYNIIRPFFRRDWLKYFTDVVESIDKLLTEIAEPDNEWKTRFGWLFFNCLYDNEAKKADSFKVFEILYENYKKKVGPKITPGGSFYETLLRFRIHYGKENNTMLAAAKKECESSPVAEGLRHLLVLQSIRSGITPEAQIEKELVAIINVINPAIHTGAQKIEMTDKLSPILQERIAEAGRVAVSNSLANIAVNIVAVLQKIRQLSQRAYIWLEFTKAELLVRKPGDDVDPKTSMRLNAEKIRLQEIDRRVEALRIMEKVMQSCKRFNDPFLIYEGACIIWNLSLPFLNENFKTHVHKPFAIATQLLDAIHSTDVHLRVQFHYEMAKLEIQDDYLAKADMHLATALRLDTSVPLTKLKEKPNENEDPALYQCPFNKNLQLLRERITPKLNIYGDNPRELDQIMLDVENAAATSSSTAYRLQVLQKNLSAILTYDLDRREFLPDPAENLVPEEIEALKKKTKWQSQVDYKKKKTIAVEIAKLALEWEFFDIVLRCADFVIVDKWNPKTESEMIITQVEYFLTAAQAYIFLLLRDGYEIAYRDALKTDEDEEEIQAENPVPEAVKAEILNKKLKITEYFMKSLKLSESLGQSWYVFNGAIHIWNNYLPIFRNPSNDGKVLTEVVDMLAGYFEVMKNSIKELEKRPFRDYDMESKIQVFGNIGIVYARLKEGKEQYDEALKVAEALLLSRLSPHTRKIVNSIKARVSGLTKGGGGSGGRAAPAGNSKAAPGATGGTGNNEQILFDVVSQLEVIQNNANKANSQELIKKCFESLTSWNYKENDETDLELHAELWTKLCRLALRDDGSNVLLKYSIRCAENALEPLKGLGDSEVSKIPPNRLRWYSLSEFLYGEVLMRLVNPEAQLKEGQDQLYKHALKHSLEAANKGCKAMIPSLVLDAGKQFWNIILKLKESVANRGDLVEPVFTLLYYLKAVKEGTEPDLILLLYNFLFKCCMETEKYQLGEQAADMCVDLVPKALQKSIWEGKMICMSKQGKNESIAMSSMKEADASLLAKIWIKIARNSATVSKQHSAYSTAIDILKRENSVEIVEVLIEFSDWLLRHNHDYKVVYEQLNLASDILLEKEIDDDEDEAQNDGNSETYQPTIFSRTLRSKRSSMNKNKMGMGGTSSHLSRQMTKGNADKMSQKSKMTSGNVASKAGISGGQNGPNGNQNSSQRLRGAKAANTKQAKSVFSEKADDPNPESLTCRLFEKLIRLHGMMALIAPSTEVAIQSALDAKLFLIKMLELSTFTANNLAQNAKRLEAVAGSNSSPTLADKAGSFGNIPTSLQDWIKYDFPGYGIQTDDPCVLSPDTFDKPWMTLYYVGYCLSILERHGLANQALPLAVFIRFFAKTVVKDETLTALATLKLSKLSLLLSLPNSLEVFKEAHEKLVASSASSTHLKEELSRTYILPTPETRQVLRKPFRFALWLDAAEDLVGFGDVAQAQELLDAAESHLVICKEPDEKGRLELIRGECFLLEGRAENALKSLMVSHKFISKASAWAKCIILTIQTLLKLGKREDAKFFLGGMTTKFKELVKSPAHASNISQIQQCLTSCQISQCFLLKAQFKKKKSASSFLELAKSLEAVGNNDQQGALLSLENSFLVLKLELFLIHWLMAAGPLQWALKGAEHLLEAHKAIGTNLTNVRRYTHAAPSGLQIGQSVFLNISAEFKLAEVKLLLLVSSLRITEGLAKVDGKLSAKEASQQSQPALSSSRNPQASNNMSTISENGPKDQIGQSPELEAYLLELDRAIDARAPPPKPGEELDKASRFLSSLESSTQIFGHPGFIARVRIERLRCLRLQREERELLIRMRDPLSNDYGQKVGADEILLLKEAINDTDQSPFNLSYNPSALIDSRTIHEEVIERCLNDSQLQALLSIASMNHSNKLQLLTATLKTYASFKFARLSCSQTQKAWILLHRKEENLAKIFKEDFAENVFHSYFTPEDMQVLLSGAAPYFCIFSFNRTLTALYTLGVCQLQSSSLENEPNLPKVILRKTKWTKEKAGLLSKINSKAAAGRKLANQRMLSTDDKMKQLEDLRAIKEQVDKDSQELLLEETRALNDFFKENLSADAPESQNDKKAIAKPALKGKEEVPVANESLAIVYDQGLENLPFETMVMGKPGVPPRREFSLCALVSQARSKAVDGYEYTRESEEESNPLVIINRLKMHSDYKEIQPKISSLAEELAKQEDD